MVVVGRSILLSSESRLLSFAQKTRLIMISNKYVTSMIEEG